MDEASINDLNRRLTERQEVEAYNNVWARLDRDRYREALAIIARDIADDGSVTQQQVDAAYALARECAGVGK